MKNKTGNKIGKAVGIASMVVVAGTGIAMAVPESRNNISDQIAESLSPKYANAIDLTQTQKLKIEQLEKANKEWETKYNTANSQKAELETQLATANNSLTTLNGNVATLSTQKVQLLTAMSEIDNAINSTTDEIEIENLEQKKQEILAKIEELNNTIATLETEKAQLQVDITTLQTEKTQLESEIAQLRTDKTNLETEIVNLQKQVEELEKVKGVSIIGTDNFYNLQDNSQLGSFNAPICASFDEFSKITCELMYADTLYTRNYSVLGSYVKNFVNSSNVYVDECCAKHYVIDMGDYQWGKLVSTSTNCNLSTYTPTLVSEDNSEIQDNKKYCVWISNINDDTQTYEIHLKTLTGVYKYNNNNYVDFDNYVVSIDGNVNEFTIDRIMGDSVLLQINSGAINYDLINFGETNISAYGWMSLVKVPSVSFELPTGQYLNDTGSVSFDSRKIARNNEFYDFSIKQVTETTVTISANTLGEITFTIDKVNNTLTDTSTNEIYNLYA